MIEILGFLFPPFIACVSMLGIFSYLGIHVLKREIIFIDIALAQIAAVGSTMALVLFHAGEHSLLAYGVTFTCIVLAAFFFSHIDKKIHQISNEAIIGVSYAIAAALALFILAMAAGGDVYLEDMLTGSILWATWPDIFLCLGVFGIVGLFHFIFRKRFQRLSESDNVRKKDVWWDFLFYVSLGIVITISVKISGVLVIFSFLIIPATISAFYSSSWKIRLLIAWGIGVLTILMGLIFSYTFDFSCGPSVVSFLGLALIVTGMIKKKKAV